MAPQKTHFQRQLRRFLDARKWSKYRFAKEAGIDLRRVSDWLSERDDQKPDKPSVEHLRAIAKTGVSLDWLLVKDSRVEMMRKDRTKFGVLARELARYVRSRVPSRYSRELLLMFSGRLPVAGAVTPSDDAATAQMFLEAVLHWTRRCVALLVSIRRGRDWPTRDSLADLVHQLRPGLPKLLSEWGHPTLDIEPLGGVASHREIDPPPGLTDAEAERYRFLVSQGSTESAALSLVRAGWRLTRDAKGRRALGQQKTPRQSKPAGRRSKKR